MNKEPLVSVVIVNYNGKIYLKECLESLYTTKYTNFEVIVIDNGSTDGSVEYIKKSIKKLKLKIIQNDKNIGPSSARNEGIKEAKGKYVVFLDNDTTVTSMWLKNAVKFLENNPNVGAGQLKLIISKTNKIDSVGEYIGQNGFLVNIVEAGKENDNGQYDEIKEIFAAKSAGMIARKDALDEINGFDDDYFIYVEESDLCWRIWLKGSKVMLIPNSIIYHRFGTSSIILKNDINYFVKFHGAKNYVQTLIKNLEFKNLIKILTIHIFLWFGIATFLFSKRKFKSSKWIILGLVWNLTNLKRILEKRRRIQKNRVVSDSEILPKIIKKREISYFLNKLKGTKKIGNARGWVKDE